MFTHALNRAMCEATVTSKEGNRHGGLKKQTTAVCVGGVVSLLFLPPPAPAPPVLRYMDTHIRLPLVTSLPLRLPFMTSYKILGSTRSPLALANDLKTKACET